MNTVNETDILRAVKQLEDKLTLAIHTGLQAVYAALAQITERHHRAMLQQERRNASFADRDRVEALAHLVSSNTASISSLTGHLQELNTRIDKLADQLTAHDEHRDQQTRELVALMNERSFSLFSGTTGYLVTALLIGSTAILTFILSHIH